MSEQSFGNLSIDEARDLLDIPATVTTTLVTDLGGMSYAGNALKLLRVNATADGWEFHAISSADVTGALGYTPTSVTGLTGPQSVAAFKTGLSLVKGDVGLGSVDDTSDASKPVSTAQLTALNLKADLASPTLTGTPLAPTAADATSNTQIATTAFVHSLITALINASPSTLDTLKELADAIGDDPNFATTVAASVATKLAKASNLSDLTNVVTARANLGTAIGSDVQAFAANLSAFAALSLVADRLPYANGTGTLALATFTAAGRALIDDADAAAQRATLGLVIGTNVQAWDADLDTLAGLTATTDNFVVSVAGAWASRTPAQVRSTLGLVIGTNVQAYDADLTTWAGITPASGIGTFLATPSSANLAAAITDETGSGSLVFSVAPTFTGRVAIGGGSLVASGIAGVHIAADLSTGRLSSGSAGRLHSFHTFYDDMAVELTAGSSGGYVSGIVCGARSYAGGEGVSIWVRSAVVLSIDNSYGNFANDTAAAAGGVPVKGIYRNGSVLMVRVT